MNPSSISREQIPWFPTVDPAVCTEDQACVAFCTHGVFQWDATAKRPMVMQPYECVVGCDGCTAICPAGAITFPSLEWLGEFLETFRAREASPTSD